MWEGLDRERVAVIPPTIDVFSPEEHRPRLGDSSRRPGRKRAGDRRRGVADRDLPATRRHAGPHRAARPSGRGGAPGPRGSRRAASVRWDALKDPLGVIRGFAEHVPATTGAHLRLRRAVRRGGCRRPGGRCGYGATRSRCGSACLLEARSRIHLAIPPDGRRRGERDHGERASASRARRRAEEPRRRVRPHGGRGDVEGGGRSSVRASAASRTRSCTGETGLLLDDPRDLAAYGAALTGLLMDPKGPSGWAPGARARPRAFHQSTQPARLPRRDQARAGPGGREASLTPDGLEG